MVPSTSVWNIIHLLAASGHGTAAIDGLQTFPICQHGWILSKSNQVSKSGFSFLTTKRHSELQESKEVVPIWYHVADNTVKVSTIPGILGLYFTFFAFFIPFLLFVVQIGPLLGILVGFCRQKLLAFSVKLSTPGYRLRGIIVRCGGSNSFAKNLDMPDNSMYRFLFFSCSSRLDKRCKLRSLLLFRVQERKPSVRSCRGSRSKKFAVPSMLLVSSR